MKWVQSESKGLRSERADDEGSSPSLSLKAEDQCPCPKTIRQREGMLTPSTFLFYSGLPQIE